MPRHVDKEQRLQDIADASARLLTKGGPAALTLKALADELGGSITLVTHFYPNRAALLDGFFTRYFERIAGDIAEIDTSSDDPLERLRAIMEWLMPLDPQAVALERMRVLNLAQSDAEPLMKPWIDKMERWTRRVLTDHVTGLVPNDQVDITVDAIRTFTNGVAISTVEHPEIWSAERQMALLDFVVTRLDLGEPSAKV